MRSLSREEVRAIDRCAIEEIGIPGVVLMENAGRNAAEEIDKLLGRLGGRRVAVVAGAGNNGGDGYVIARHLVNRGYDVATFLLAGVESIPGDARMQLNILRRLGHDLRPASGSEFAGDLRDFDLIVDAAGGTGIRGALRDDLARIVEQINAAGRPVVAVDIPTGLDCDTGVPAGVCVRAKLTVTFVARKRGFDHPASEANTGPVRVADIGIYAAAMWKQSGC